MKMTDEQIELLRFAIQREIEYLSIDGMEHGAWGWAEQVADEKWKEFQESFSQEVDTPQTGTEALQNPL
jgi:hypothetical protein